MQRRIAAPEYRRHRAFGIAHVAGGIVWAAAGIVCLSDAAYGWATLFLVIGTRAPARRKTVVYGRSADGRIARTTLPAPERDERPDC